uniref:H(+)-transporting two-sector ATPase n=1 Tax=prasinophyte sp. MBIC10622 TaxID=156113 RepID=A0A650AL02_9CHLO|nr:ATP synthase F0 subunit 8 [prasinophyte sp. MBIC10622]
MPQLDTVTYFSQFFWMCVCYLGFYVVLMTYFLPRIGRLLKLRRRKSQTSTDAFASTTAETDQVREAYDGLLIEGLREARNSLQQAYEASETWAHSVVAEAYKGPLASMNTAYLGRIGAAKIQQEVVLQDLRAVTSPRPHHGAASAYEALFNAHLLKALAA